ncbi:hypothetical protein [Haloarchaeobius sp. HME9146]|uniref:hypothetical protein n=1 Tax=Haloarchaeobius sp. HME9146 TaxID=2978732 RepID=UPI0021C1C7A8|nr:hypothetical protein [Haloarchaeobius sp. HME9146]MCT9095989.1 hypothetical protein [Haloarchaeobius sp. HME9146]
MRRRQLLTAIGGTASLAAVGSVGGATGRGNNRFDARRRYYRSRYGRRAGHEPRGGTFPESEPFARVTLGTRDGVDFPDNQVARTIRLWNDSPEPRTIGVRIRDGKRMQLWQIREYPANGWLEITLNQPKEYVVAVDVEGRFGGQTKITDYDCNTATTTIRVEPTGTVKSTTATTRKGCPGAELLETTLTAESGRCGTLEDAEVIRENEEVVVDGLVLTPNPCYTARVTGTELKDDVLTVTIGATKSADAACIQCIGHVPYQSRMRFRNAYPKRVVVDHEVNGRKTRMVDTELE